MTARLLRYQASKDSPPANEVAVIRCYHGKLLGVHIRRGMSCLEMMWRLCK